MEQNVNVHKSSVLSNLKEACELLQNKYPDDKIEFPKFADSILSPVYGLNYSSVVEDEAQSPP